MKQRQPKESPKSRAGSLLLRKETLRTLTDGQLSTVVGGAEDTRTSVTAPALRRVD